MIEAIGAFFYDLVERFKEFFSSESQEEFDSDFPGPIE